MYDEAMRAINAMNKCLEELGDLRKTNPELAKKKAMEKLQKEGIIGKDGKLLLLYNEQKVNDEDSIADFRKIDDGEEER